MITIEILSASIPLPNINILLLYIDSFNFQTKSLSQLKKKKTLSLSLSQSRLTWKTLLPPQASIFFTFYMHLICLSIMHTVYTLHALDLSFKYAYSLVVYFLIISKIKMKIHYEFTTIKICRSNQQKAKKHYSCK